jgi:hypothetical protein
MKTTVFWVVAPCSLVENYGRFGGAYSKNPTTTEKTVIFIL